MNYTASHCVRLDENQAGPLSERRSWPRFFQYNFSVRLSKDKHSKNFQKNILNKENCFIFHNIMIMLLGFFFAITREVFFWQIIIYIRIRRLVGNWKKVKDAIHLNNRVYFSRTIYCVGFSVHLQTFSFEIWYVFSLFLFSLVSER